MRTQYVFPKLYSGTRPSCKNSELNRDVSLLPPTHTRKHGMKGTKEYKAWDSIKQRCFNPNHKDYWRYGGRGIVLCDQWKHDFSAFFAEIGYAPSAAHSVDRINGLLGYQPGNVRWATSIEQSRNRSNNVYYTAFGETKLREDWRHDPRLACPRTAFEKRLEDGWDFVRAFTTPKTFFGGPMSKAERKAKQEAQELQFAMGGRKSY